MFGEKRHNVKMQGCTLLCRNEAKYPTLEKLQLLTSISQLPTAAQLPKETHCCCILLCAVLTKTECKKFLCCISKVASSSGFGPYHNSEMSRYPSMLSFITFLQFPKNYEDRTWYFDVFNQYPANWFGSAACFTQFPFTSFILTLILTFYFKHIAMHWLQIQL